MPKNRKQKQRNSKRPVSGGVETNAFVLSNNANLKHSIATMPRGIAMWPDEIITQGRTVINFSSTLTSFGTNYYSFKANGVMNAYGPSINGASYANNVPSGSDNYFGSLSPYGLCWTLDTQLNLQLINQGTAQSYVTLLPSIASYSTISGYSPANLAEQRGAVQVFVPANNSVPVKLDASFSPWDILGVKRDYYMNNITYGQVVATDPTDVCYFHVVNTGSSATLAVIATITIRFKFGGLNMLTSTEPS